MRRSWTPEEVPQDGFGRPRRLDAPCGRGAELLLLPGACNRLGKSVTPELVGLGLGNVVEPRLIEMAIGKDQDDFSDVCSGKLVDPFDQVLRNALFDARDALRFARSPSEKLDERL